MKLFYTLIVASILVFSACIAQAEEDPYSGIYTCRGESQKGCGECDGYFHPPTGIVVKKEGGFYKFCPQFSGDTSDQDCMMVEVKDGQAFWTQKSSTSMEGVSFFGDYEADITDSSMTLQAAGNTSGRCQCELLLKAVCTK